MKPLCITVVCLTLLHALPKANGWEAVLLILIAILFASFISAAPRSK